MWPKKISQVWLLLVVFSMLLCACIQSRSTMEENPVDPDNQELIARGREDDVAAIKAQVLPEIESSIASARASGAKKVAPLSHARAVEKAKALDAFISVNPEKRDEIYALAAEASFTADRLNFITQQANRVKKMAPEEVVLWVEDQLYTISGAIGIPDMRNHSAHRQVDTIVNTVHQLKEENSLLSDAIKALEVEMADQKAHYQEAIDRLHVQNAVLENQSLEDRLAKEKMAKEWLAMEQHLAAEKRFDQRFLAVRSLFKVDEADVLRQDHQLIIRLKAIHFPVGESAIVIENYELLGKVQKAILTFEKPRVIVEGHTDATGSDLLNMDLSRQRAEAVRQFLATDPLLVPENISALGHGAQRPLASNKTSAGRAVNRRIDILIIPETKFR